MMNNKGLKKNQEFLLSTSLRLTKMVTLNICYLTCSPYKLFKMENQLTDASRTPIVELTTPSPEVVCYNKPIYH